MGHASSIAYGIAKNVSDRKVWCIDGDGAILMHLGAMSIIGNKKPKNLVHILINNQAHETVGGMATSSNTMDYRSVAKACGYATVDSYAVTREDIEKAVEKLLAEKKAAFLEIRIHKGLRGKLPPLDISHEGLISELMNELA